MRQIFSYTAGAIALLAVFSWANLAVAQRFIYQPAERSGITPAADEIPAPITVQTQADQAAESRIRAILRTSFSGKASATTLIHFLAELAHSTGLPIELDKQSLEDASIEADAAISSELPPVSIHAALGLILEPLQLAWTIRDGRLLVTTADKASTLLILKVYPVRDLVNIRSRSNPLANNYLPLIQTIADTVAPDSWDEVGGAGTIQPFDPSGSLVIYQTFERHEEIVILLAALRQARAAQPIVPIAFKSPQHAGRHVSQRDRQGDRHRNRQPDPAATDEPRYVVAPAAQWLVPRTHE